MRRLALIAALSLAPAGAAFSQEAEAAGAMRPSSRPMPSRCSANPRCPPISPITLT
ncbi:hypothetical protein ACFSYD_12425 [Paracoccus aerius]